jgi:hypothetical protein
LMQPADSLPISLRIKFLLKKTNIFLIVFVKS